MLRFFCSVARIRGLFINFCFYVCSALPFRMSICAMLFGSSTVLPWLYGPCVCPFVPMNFGVCLVIVIVVLFSVLCVLFSVF